MSTTIEQITLSEVYRRVMGCQNCQKVREFARLRKNQNFLVVLRQNYLYWKVASLLYVKCTWCLSQKHEIKCLSSIIRDFIGCDKLQKVGNRGSKTHFWSPLSLSSEQCFEIHISHIYLKIWGGMVPEILKSNNLKLT